MFEIQISSKILSGCICSRIIVDCSSTVLMVLYRSWSTWHGINNIDGAIVGDFLMMRPMRWLSLTMDLLGWMGIAMLAVLVSMPSLRIPHDANIMILPLTMVLKVSMMACLLGVEPATPMRVKSST